MSAKVSKMSGLAFHTRTSFSDVRTRRALNTDRMSQWAQKEHRMCKQLMTKAWKLARLLVALLTRSSRKQPMSKRTVRRPSLSRPHAARSWKNGNALTMWRDRARMLMMLSPSTCAKTCKST
mmetsp:Transcript_91228/g.261088  ORF Transcript_91228/g.261088 Transcript_91228/m.261088 type:complete len:122 (-) Transcript_91228:1229-1594(-)